MICDLNTKQGLNVELDDAMDSILEEVGSDYHERNQKRCNWNVAAQTQVRLRLCVS